MGSPEGEKGRYENERQHWVTLTKGFYLGVHEVTQAEWKAVMGGDNNPSHFKGDELPVDIVSWDNAVAFCRKLNAKEGWSEDKGWRYQLPTEAEWEYACRAGTETPFHFGDTLSTDWANYDRQKTTPVGSFNRPNAWGLHDMHGNVWEWCADWYAEYPEKDLTDPKGPKSGDDRVCRGGSWLNPVVCCRAASRDRYKPGAGYTYLGFRVCFRLD
jgi:formylglycine-generating enzyme required for sulfatase activity